MNNINNETNNTMSCTLNTMYFSTSPNSTRYDLTDIRNELVPLQMVFDGSTDNSNWTFEFGKVFYHSENFDNNQLNNKPNTESLYLLLKDKYKGDDFRTISGSKCIEVQNCRFIADKDWIVREPNYDYVQRELEWYKSQSLYVDDIPGKTPKIWESIASKTGDVGKINSNYGWCIFSNENGNQYRECLNALIKDNNTRQAVMFYNRPSMHKDANKDDMHDFMCTYQVQCFLNKYYYKENENSNSFYVLRYIVYQRSQDLVFGYDNDILWHDYVANKLCRDLTSKIGIKVYPSFIECNVGSAHIYERHFSFLTNK